MNTRFSRMGAVLLLAVVGCGPAASVPLQQSRAYYYVEDQRIDLVPSTKYAAIELSPEAPEGALDTLVAALLEATPLAPQAFDTPTGRKLVFFDLEERTEEQITSQIAGAVPNAPEYSALPVFTAGSVEHVLVNEFVVQFADGTSDTAAGELIREAGATVVARNKRIPGRYTITFAEMDPLEALAASNELHRNPRVDFSNPDLVRIMPPRVRR